MSKKKTIIEKKSNLDKIPKKIRNIIATIVIAIPLLFYFLPYAMNNVQPIGSDYLASASQTKLWKDWSKSTGETVLWNPNIFGGEPIYPRISPKLIHLDTFIGYLSKIFFWAFWYFFAGGLGMYFLLKYKKIPWYLAIIVAIVFVLLPDWQAQIGEGHSSKFRAIMTLPWFILSFTYFFEKKSWISTGLFALSFSWLVRTHHFQIIYIILVKTIWDYINFFISHFA